MKSIIVLGKEMVIYLQTMRSWLGKIIAFLILLFLIGEFGYYLSYLRYKDEEYVNIEALKLEKEELQKDNEELYALTNVEKPATYIARVGIRNIHNFYEEILLENKGYDVKVGDPVMNSEGLVGVIAEVGDNIKVNLTTSNISVSVLVNGTYGTFHNGRITMIDKNASIQEGDKVYTSGLTSIPEGIYVGEITKVLPDAENLGIEAKIKLVNTSHLNYVSIYTRRD